MDHGTRDPAPAPTTAPEPTENTPQRRKRIAQEQLAREKQENEAIEAEAELAEVKRRRRAAAKRLADLQDTDYACGNPERPSTSPQRPLGEIRSPDLPAGWSRVESSSEPGRFFYFNKKKNISQWDPPAPEIRPLTPPRHARPPPPPPRRPPSPPPPPRKTWLSHVDGVSGKPYWYVAETGETTWDDPTRPRPAPGPDDELDFRGSQGHASVDATARHRALFGDGRPSAGQSSLSRSFTSYSDSQTSLDSIRSARSVDAVDAAATLGVDASAAALYESSVSEEYKSQHSVEFLAQHLAQLRETKPNVEKSLDVAIIATGPFAPKSIIDTKDGRGVGILVGHWTNINYFAFQKGGKKALPDLSRICSTLGESFCKCLSLGEAREKLKYYISKLGLRGGRINNNKEVLQNLTDGQAKSIMMMATEAGMGLNEILETFPFVPKRPKEEIQSEKARRKRRKSEEAVAAASLRELDAGPPRQAAPSILGRPVASGPAPHAAPAAPSGQTALDRLGSLEALAAPAAPAAPSGRTALDRVGSLGVLAAPAVPAAPSGRTALDRVGSLGALAAPPAPAAPLDQAALDRVEELKRRFPVEYSLDPKGFTLFPGHSPEQQYRSDAEWANLTRQHHAPGLTFEQMQAYRNPGPWYLRLYGQQGPTPPPRAPSDNPPPPPEQPPPRSSHNKVWERNRDAPAPAPASLAAAPPPPPPPPPRPMSGAGAPPPPPPADRDAAPPPPPSAPVPTPRPPVPKPRGRVPVNRSGKPAEWDALKGEWINVPMKGRGRDTWEVCPRCSEPTEYLDDCYEPVVICENKHCRDEYHLHCAGLSDGIVKAWAHEFRFNLSLGKHEVMRVGMPSVAGRVVFWSWPRGELAPYVRTRQHYASYDLVPEAYTLKEAVVYLGCWISESLSADYSAQKRLWEAWEIYKAAKDSVQSVSELRRADVLSVMNAFFRGKQEYPGGPTTPLSGEIGFFASKPDKMNHGGLSGEVENAYLATLRVTLGGVATHMPNAALLEITGSRSPAWRRRASRAIFKRALEAVAVGERAVVLDVLRSARSDAFTARSITLALDDATTDLGLGRRPQTLAYKPQEWRTRVKTAARFLERKWRHAILRTESSSRRLAAAVSWDRGPPALSAPWRRVFFADSSCKGNTAFLMSTLCEQYRLVPHVRSKFGGPAEGYCDICRTNVASGRADIAHLIFECRSVDFVATRARWRAEYEGEIAAAGAIFPSDADPLMVSVGLVRPKALRNGVRFATLSLRLAIAFVRHWGRFEHRIRDEVRSLPPCKY